MSNIEYEERVFIEAHLIATEAKGHFSPLLTLLMPLK
jgi:hypothetical protein